MAFRITVDQWEIEVLHHALTDMGGAGLLGGAEVIVPSKKGPRRVKFAGCWDYADMAREEFAHADEILYVDGVFVNPTTDVPLDLVDFVVLHECDNPFGLVCDEDGGPDLESIAFEIHEATKVKSRG